MNRRTVFLLGGAAALAACASPPEISLGADGKPLPQLYVMKPEDAAAVDFRMLDSVNTLRAAKGVPPVAFNAQLNAAAATHSRDMAVQNRPWHFGSDGSSPLDRVKRAGYPLMMLGENISETYETELETLAAWMSEPDTRGVVLDPNARDLGFAFFQDPNGKIWWTLLTGG